MTAQRTVAIISDDVLQRHRLQQAVGKYGMEVGFIGDPERFVREPTEPSVCLSIVELNDEDDYPEMLEKLLADENCTVLFGPGQAPEPGRQDYVRWERRLFSKLQDHFGALETLDSQDSIEALAEEPHSTTEIPLPTWIRPVTEPTPATEVWILGASLGGPAAVKEFLDRLPAGLPVAFVYAQHIDSHFSRVLSQVLTRHAHYHLVQAHAGNVLRCGEVLQIPVDNELLLDEEGGIELRDDPWPGPYGPSIDQVMINIARQFGANCHAILFSGMGNDGAIAAPVLQQQGSQIWIQSPESCASGAMPESVAATGCTSFQGTPSELAAQLVRTIEEHCLLNDRNEYNSA